MDVTPSEELKLEKSTNSYIEMLVVYKDDKNVSKTKLLIPISRNSTHFLFINPKSNKLEMILRNNVIRMEETKKMPKFIFDAKAYHLNF